VSSAIFILVLLAFLLLPIFPLEGADLILIYLLAIRVCMGPAFTICLLLSLRLRVAFYFLLSEGF
jgi:hypothetical protein